ncbi:tetratricopeptide repeat protein [Ketobacter sp.]|uniref:tetratricopeptide repeat protein n=1 Tax=Ketobacter sp. TaxID=2083498 RepID=UPI0025BE49BF|nr:tetratricopeptide repeat protein [Ketobacter sp.]
MKFKNTFVMLLVALTLVACDGVEGRKQKYLDQAQQSFAEKDYDKARVNYKNVLKIDPKSIEGLIGYAETLEKMADWRGAVGKYRAVIEIEPDNAKAKVKLGQLYLLANEAQMALDLADEVLLLDPKHSGGLTLKAGAVAKSGQPAEALLIVEQAYKLNPKELDTLVLYSTMLVANGREQQGLDLLESALKEWPDSVTLHSMLANYYLSRNQLLLAEEELKALITIEPQNVGFKHRLVEFYEKTGRTQEAEDVYQQIISSEEDKTDAIIALHNLHASRGDLEQAEAVLTRYIEQDPDDFDLKFQLAGFYVRTERETQAEEMYRDYLNENDAVSVKAQTRLAYLLEKQGKLNEAEELLAAVLKDHPGNIDALSLRGKMHLEQEDALNAIPDLRAVVNANPENIQALKWLGLAYIMNGDAELAIQMLKAVVNLQPRDLPARMQLASLYHDNEQTAKAIEQYQLCEKIAPDDQVVKQKLVSVYLAADNSHNARAYSEKLVAMDPNNPLYPLYLGLASQLDADHQMAITYFDQSLQLKPGALEPMSAKVRSLIALNQLDEASRWLDSVVNSVENNSPAYNFKGEIHLAKKEYQSANQAFAKALDIYPGWWLPYRNLMLSALAQGDKTKAIQVLEQGVEASKGSARLRLELARLYESESRVDDAIEQYEKVMRDDSGNALAINNLVMLLVNNRSDDQAQLERADRLSKPLLEKDNPLYQDTVGWLYYTKGEYDKALALIKRAQVAYPANPEINYHLGMTYYRISEFEKARQYLTASVQGTTPFRGRESAEDTLLKLEDKLSAR